MELRTKNWALIANKSGFGIYKHNNYCHMSFMAIVMFHRHPKFKITPNWKYFGWLNIYTAGY